MEELVKKILEYMVKGYSINDVMDAMKDLFSRNEDKYYLLVKNTFDKARKGMPAEEYDKIVNLRKERAETLKKAKMQDIADKVKARTESNTSATSLKEAMAQAANMVARLEDVSYNTARVYTKAVYPEFYDYYANNRNHDETYLIEMAEKIIKCDMSQTVARNLPGYTKMMNYVESNRPELFAKINELYASHSAYESRNFNIVSSNQENQEIYNNKSLLIAILLEYRIPYNIAIDFINANSDIFLKVGESLSADNFSETLLNETYDKRNALRWYLNESTGLDEFVDYRTERFNEFLLKFNILKSDLDKLKKLVYAETKLSSSIVEKINNRHSEERLNLTQEELRNLLNYVYKNGLTDDQLEGLVGFAKTTKTRFIEMLKDTDNIDDQMLLSGLAKLKEYKLDVANYVGRK